MDNRPIGVFDSGLGGLTTVRQIIEAMPGEDIIYFGDNLNAPYGNKSKPELIDIAVNNVTNNFFIFLCKMIIYYCKYSMFVL